MLWFVVLTPTYHAAVVWRCALSSPRWSLHRAADVASAPPGLKVKHPDLSFYKELADEPEPEWREVLKQKVVRGSWFKSEVVFFHEPSETLILGDLIENHSPLKFWVATPSNWFSERHARAKRKYASQLSVDVLSTQGGSPGFAGKF